MGKFEGLVGHNSQHRARKVVLTQDSIQVKDKLGNTGKHKHRYEMVPAFKMVVGGNPGQQTRNHEINPKVLNCVLEIPGCRAG